MVRATKEQVKKYDPRIFLYLSLVVIIALTVIDLERSPEMMIGYFFTIPVIMSYFTERTWNIYLIAVISTAASLVAFSLAPAGVTSNLAINLPFSIVMIWLVALLGNYQVISNRRLSEERNRLRAILDTLPVGVAICDSKGILVEANDQIDTIWGGKFTIARGIAESQSCNGFRPDSGAGLRPEEWPLARSVQREEMVVGETIDIEHMDGTKGTLLISSAPIKDDEGKITGAVMVAMDVTEERAIERELAVKAEDLVRSNKELQQFAYVASHDLKEPLRMVTIYVQLLQRRYSSVLDDQAKEFIGFAVDGSKRMYSLVDDLLTYSRVETSVAPFGTVDMGQVMDTALKDLKEAMDISGGEVKFGDLPEVYADYHQMVQLMENLVGNAIKFRRDETSLVQVSAKLCGNEWVFSVKDNGIGIAQEYSTKVFQMFQRLHARETFPGTGIGLAICKKVVERHGGRIWFDSEVGVGTTFYFTLPVKGN